MAALHSIAPTSPAREVALDVLRALAVFLVIGRHVWEAPPQWPSWARGPFEALRCGGWVGVDLFFVLSGFLVAGLLFKEYQRSATLSVRRFYVRRGFKIYPGFWVLLLFSPIFFASFGQPVPVRRLVSEMLFVQSYFPGIWWHTWSLAVEEHFYLALPPLLLVLRRVGSSHDPFRSLPRLFLVLAVSLLVLRSWISFRRPFDVHTHFFPTHLRIDSLMMGVVVAYAYHFHRSWFVETLGPRRGVLIAGGLLLLAPPFWLPLETTPFVSSLGLTLAYLGGAALVCGLVLTRLGQVPGARTLGYVGSHSYAIYLWHPPIQAWAFPTIEARLGWQLPFLWRAILFVTASVLVGILMSNAIEFPLLRLRDRWFPSRSGAVITEPSP